MLVKENSARKTELLCPNLCELMATFPSSEVSFFLKEKAAFKGYKRLKRNYILKTIRLTEATFQKMMARTEQPSIFPRTRFAFGRF